MYSKFLMEILCSYMEISYYGEILWEKFMKNKGDEATITTPWWREPHTGKIIDIYGTAVGEIYVIEFADGTKCTAKESDLQ